jgi:hypothetical protein
VGTQFFNQEVAEVSVVAIAKHFPDIRITQSGESGNLEFEEMVLSGVEVDCVDAARLINAEGENVVTCRSNSEDHVVGSDFE